MDVRNIKMTVVMPESSREALNIAARMQLSRYFRTSIVRTAREAEERMISHKAEAFCIFPLISPISSMKETSRCILRSTESMRIRRG